MDSEDLRKALGRPNLLKLREVAKGIRVGKVLGERVLVRPVKPYTDMDRVEEQKLLVVPETVRETNTPLPSTGLIIALGDAVSEALREDLIPGRTYVMFSKFAGVDIRVEEQEFRIVDLSEIMCTLEPAEV